MLRFRLGGIPVEAPPGHFLTSALIAYMWLGGSGPTSWPQRLLADPTPQARMLAFVAGLAALTLLVTLSILAHELGHAVVSRLYGWQPHITMMWFGGQTHPGAPRPMTWRQDLAVTAAGPAMSAVLAVLGFVALRLGAGRHPVSGFLFEMLLEANFLWTLFNLVPVMPLDGGKIVNTLSMRLFGPRGFLLAQAVALLASAAIVYLAIRTGQPILGLFFAVFGFRALSMLAAGWRAEREGDVGDTPQARTLDAAAEALREGRLDDVRALAAPVLEEGAPPVLASRAHHLLGWVALKEGRGRPALDHFAQVSRRPVETQALAAAFSLVGDEPRALTLWDLAWRETGNTTVLHEYAGSLLRAGRTQDALRLPDVDPLTAYTCATRVLAIRGAWSEAAALAEAGLAHAPSATLAYEAACAHARARSLDDAVRLLHRATALGFRDAAYADSDEDLASLHGHPGFAAWLTALRESPAP